MNDLDDRLRSTLHELAGTVPPSPHARADLARRLTRRDRRPMLVAAAAMLVVATVVVSVAVTHGDDPDPGPTATAPSGDHGPGWSRMTTTKLPNGDLAGPIELGRFKDHDVTYVVMLSVVAMSDGEHWSLEAWGPPDTTWPTGYGNLVPTWPAEAPGSVVQTHPVLGEGGIDSGPLSHLMLFLTSPAVTALEVRRGDGQPVTVRQVAKTPGATFYLADFAGPTAGFGYTATDAAGNVLESAIT